MRPSCSLVTADCSPPASPPRPNPRGVDQRRDLADGQRRPAAPTPGRTRRGFSSACQSNAGAAPPRRAAPTARRWPRSRPRWPSSGVKPDDLQTRNLDSAAHRLWRRTRPLPRRQSGRGQVARHGQASAMRSPRRPRPAPHLVGGPDLRISDRESAQPFGLCRRLPRRAGRAPRPMPAPPASRSHRVLDHPGRRRIWTCRSALCRQHIDVAAEMTERRPAALRPHRAPAPFRRGRSTTSRSPRARVDFSADRESEASGESRRALQRLIGADDFAELLLEAAVAAVAVGVVACAPAPNSAGAARAVGVVGQAEHAERVPLAGAEARRRAPRDRAGREARARWRRADRRNRSRPAPGRPPRC